MIYLHKYSVSINPFNSKINSNHITWLKMHNKSCAFTKMLQCIVK